MTLLTRNAYRLALVAGGLLIARGGSMHPDADASDSLRQELATMTADPAWVPGHALVTVGTVLVVLALWTVLRRGLWDPSVRLPLLVAAVAMTAYSVETVMHLASAVDSEALAHGHAAPVAWTHVGMSIVLYPVSGLAVAWLSLALGRAWGGWRVLVVVPGVVGGLLHASSVPLTLLLPDAELSLVFAGAGVLTALWALLLGLGARNRPAQPAAVPASAPAAARLQPAS
jgi:hypothetical protein